MQTFWDEISQIAKDNYPTEGQSIQLVQQQLQQQLLVLLITKLRNLHKVGGNYILQQLEQPHIKQNWGTQTEFQSPKR